MGDDTMSYLIVAALDNNNRITKYNTAKTLEEAEALVARIGEGAFYLEGYDNEEISNIIVDPENKSFNVSIPPKALNKHLKQYREKKILDGITVNGIRVKGDSTTIERLGGAARIATRDNTFTTPWSAENGRFDLNAAQIIALDTAGAAHMRKCFEAYFAVLDDIEDYDTIEELETAFDEAYDGV